MKYAISVASIAKHEGRYKMAAVVARRNDILSSGINTHKTHPQANTPYKTRHAEFNAVNGKDVAGATLYVIRLAADGRLAASSPCKACRELLKTKGIKSVVHMTKEGHLYEDHNY